MSTKHRVVISDESKAILDDFKDDGEDYDDAISNLHGKYQTADLFFRTEKKLVENDEDDWIPLEEV